jgi:hypothetical protein
MSSTCTSLLAADAGNDKGLPSAYLFDRLCREDQWASSLYAYAIFNPDSYAFEVLGEPVVVIVGHVNAAIFG